MNAFEESWSGDLSNVASSHQLENKMADKCFINSPGRYEMFFYGNCLKLSLFICPSIEQSLVNPSILHCSIHLVPRLPCINPSVLTHLYLSSMCFLTFVSVYLHAPGLSLKWNLSWSALLLTSPKLRIKKRVKQLFKSKRFYQNVTKTN